jgi:hypothetical protein
MELYCQFLDVAGEGTRTNSVQNKVYSVTISGASWTALAIFIGLLVAIIISAQHNPQSPCK